MSILTISLPDETATRLKEMANSQGVSLDALLAQLGSNALASWDCEKHFHALAATADVNAALAVLDRLDHQQAKTSERAAQ